MNSPLKGTIFANFVLVMRLTVRQQSAISITGACEEKQVTIGDTTFKLKDLS
jgi:hypothetical protein